MKKVVGICIDANNIGQISWWNNQGSKLVREGERKDYYDKTTGRRLFTIVEVKGLLKHFVIRYYSKKFIDNPHKVAIEF